MIFRPRRSQSTHSNFRVSIGRIVRQVRKAPSCSRRSGPQAAEWLKHRACSLFETEWFENPSRTSEILIVVETAAGLFTEPSRLDIFYEQWARTILRITQAIVQ